MSRKKIKGIAVRKHLDTSTFSKSKGGCRWSLLVAIRGVKKYYPIEPAIYMDPQFWRAQVDPATGKELRGKVIIHTKGNADSRAKERALAAKEEEMEEIVSAILDCGETPTHEVLWRHWGKGASKSINDCYARLLEVREGSWRGGLKGSTARASRMRFQHVATFAGNTPVSAINAEWVRRFHNWLLKEAKRPKPFNSPPGLSANTANGILIVLGAVLNIALEEGHVKENAVTSYRKSKTAIPVRMQPGRSNPLTEDEVAQLQKVWDAGELDGKLKATLQQALVSIYTGFRVSDLAQLSDPQNFIRTGEHLQISSVKTGRQLKILVTKRLAEVLAQREDGSLLLEPITDPDHQSKRLRALLKALGMERGYMVWHDLRKTFVNIMYARTGDLSAISKAVGHTSTTVTEGHYLKASTDHIDRVMSTLDSIGTKRESVSGLEVLNEVAAMVAANPSLRVTPRMAEMLRAHCGMEIGGHLRAV